MNRLDWIRECYEKYGIDIGYRGNKTPKSDKAEAPKPVDKPVPAKKEK